MLERLFGRESMPALESMVHFASARQKVIAKNIANVDTPGYKAQDLSVKDFRTAMARAFAAQKESPLGTWSLERHRSVRPVEGGGLAARPDDAEDFGILKHTENNVDLEIEMGKQVENLSMHGLASNLLAHQFHMLREAISERVDF